MILYDARGDYIVGPTLPLATRRGREIPNEQRSPLAPARMSAAKDIMLGGHTSASVRSLSSVYNCMGMVFASRRTWVGPEHLYMILEDDDYRQVSSEGDLEPGDVVVYKDEADIAVHVGLVTEVRPNVGDAKWEIFALSQWGADGEYFHHVNDVNPRLGKPAEYWTDRI